jgi:hypothetical protein
MWTYASLFTNWIWQNKKQAWQFSCFDTCSMAITDYSITRPIAITALRLLVILSDYFNSEIIGHDRLQYVVIRLLVLFSEFFNSAIVARYDY